MCLYAPSFKKVMHSFLALSIFDPKKTTQISLSLSIKNVDFSSKQVHEIINKKTKSPSFFPFNKSNCKMLKFYYVNHFFSMIFFLFDPTLESYFTSKGKNYIKLNFYCQFRFKKLNQFLKIDFHSHIKQKLKKSFIGRQRYYLKWKWRSCKKL